MQHTAGLFLSSLSSRIFLREIIIFSSLSGESSNQAWHPGSGPCACGLCVSWWPAKESVPEGGTNCKPALRSYDRPSGHRSKGYWLELSSLFCFLAQTHKPTQDTCTNGQTHIVEYKNTSAQWGLSCMLMPGLEWLDVHFGFNCVVLCISPGLIMGLYGAWVGEDACMKQWQRAFSGQMRRWRASSAWALLLYLIWSGVGLLLLQHSGWSLPVHILAILKNGFCQWWWTIWST